MKLAAVRPPATVSPSSRSAAAHRAEPSPAADPSVCGQGKAGPEKWERWTHHMPKTAIGSVGEFAIPYLIPGDHVALPARLHAQAESAGLVCLGTIEG